MDSRTMFATLDRILESSKSAILATVDPDGSPRMRWMTPTLLQGREGSLFTLTGSAFRKLVELKQNARVQWICQSKSMDEILTVSGTVAVIDNPRTTAEVLESVGKELSVFWKVNPAEANFVVLETRVTSFEYFKPKTGESITVQAG